jgi:hypothetical protein
MELYEIKMSECDICAYEAIGVIQRAVRKVGAIENRKLKDEYRKQYDELRKAIRIKKPCFFFVADCGGDSITLCEKHFKKALRKLQNFDKK